MNQTGFLVDDNEFLVVRHSVLNGNSYDVDALVKDTLTLEKHTCGRKVVPCFEGDLLQVAETGEIVLTHQNFARLHQKKYDKLREKNIATSLREVLDKFSEYKEQTQQRVVLCLELKLVTDRDTIDQAVKQLREYDLEDVYFDSFFGGKLDLAEHNNIGNEIYYKRSHHLIGNVGNFKIGFPSPSKGYDIITVPYAMSFGELDEPVIYGTVGSTEILERISKRPNVVGAYVRLKEGSGITGKLRMLWNSVTNTENLRRTNISLFSNA